MTTTPGLRLASMAFTRGWSASGTAESKKGFSCIYRFIDRDTNMSHARHDRRFKKIPQMAHQTIVRLMIAVQENGISPDQRTAASYPGVIPGLHMRHQISVPFNGQKTIFSHEGSALQMDSDFNPQQILLSLAKLGFEREILLAVVVRIGNAHRLARGR